MKLLKFWKVTKMSATPEHYQSPSGTTPWDLQRGMKSSGNAFVDGRRCDAIKYAFRVKQNMAEDLRKAAHCLMEAVKELEAGEDKSSAVDRVLDEVFDEKGVPKSNHEPLGVYNDWKFWEISPELWMARRDDCRLSSQTKKGLFDVIDRANFFRKTHETPL